MEDGQRGPVETPAGRVSDRAHGQWRVPASPELAGRWVEFSSEHKSSSSAHEIVAQTFKGNRNKNPQRKTNQTERKKRNKTERLASLWSKFRIPSPIDWLFLCCTS